MIFFCYNYILIKIYCHSSSMIFTKQKSNTPEEWTFLNSTISYFVTGSSSAPEADLVYTTEGQLNFRF
jgi:hypothetical protein